MWTLLSVYCHRLSDKIRFGLWHDHRLLFKSFQCSYMSKWLESVTKVIFLSLLVERSQHFCDFFKYIHIILSNSCASHRAAMFVFHHMGALLYCIFSLCHIFSCVFFRHVCMFGCIRLADFKASLLCTLFPQQHQNKVVFATQTYQFSVL